MEVLGRVFAFALFSLLMHTNSLTTVMKYKYVNEGDTVILPCYTDNVSLSTWLSRSQISKNRLISIVRGLTKHPLLTYLDNIQITKEEEDRRTYNLVISNISAVMEGVYTCNKINFNKLKQEMYTIVFIENPSVVEIIDNGTTIDRRIVGTENESTEIVCRAKDDIPVKNISWYKNGMFVKSRVSKTLSWSFAPTRSDNNMPVSCVVYIPDLDKPLVKSAVLDIRYLQITFSPTNTDELIEGRSLEVSCYGDGNPPVELVYIKKGNQRLNICKESSSCIYKLNGTRQDSGIYTCHVFRSPTKDESTATTTVNVLYPPDVTVYRHGNSLHCKTEGNPNNISFVAWQHYSEFGKIIRSFNGSVHLDIDSYKRYATNGIYTCEAKNGIPNVSGYTVTSGNYSLQENGTPEILPNTELTQYGQYHEPLSVIIFVYSVPPVLSVRVYKTNENIAETINVTFQNSNLTIILFEKQIVLKGYEIRLQIHSLTRTDIGNYTVVIENKIGTTKSTLLVLDIDTNVPSAPIVTEIRIIDNNVLVSFQQPLIDEQIHQFVVEYRKINANTWTLTSIINNTITETYSSTISGLEYGVEYCVQVYALNDAGRSNSTEVCSIKTVNNSTYMYIFIMLPVVIIGLCAYFGFRKRRTIQSWIVRLRRNPGSHNDNYQNEQALTNVNIDVEVQYDEIDDVNLSEMEDIRVNLWQHNITRPTGIETVNTENANLDVATANNNVATEVQYDEIDEDILQGMDEIRVNLRRQENNRPTNPKMEGETKNTNLIVAATYTNVATAVQYNEIDADNLHEIEEIRVNRRRQDTNVQLTTK